MSFLLSSGTHHGTALPPYAHQQDKAASFPPTGPTGPTGVAELAGPPSSPSTLSTTAPQSDPPYILHYHDSDDCEQHIACESIYDALVWARDEAQEHASKVYIYKLCHVELAP